MCGEYLKSAWLLAEQARRLEDDPPQDRFVWRALHNSMVTSSILNSACSLEATVNEWFSFPEEIPGRGKRENQLRIQRLWSLGIPRTASFQILQKYQVGLALVGKPAFAEGEEPYQSARLVVELRNWLMHYEPTWEPVPEQEEAGTFPLHRLVRRLRGKFAPNPLCHEGAPFWPYKCLGAGCALWAAEAVTSFMDDFFERADSRSTMRPDMEWLAKVRQLGQAASWKLYGA